MLPLVLAGLLLLGLVLRALDDFDVVVLFEVEPQSPDGVPVMTSPVCHFMDSLLLTSAACTL
jgi:hypothetical protein